MRAQGQTARSTTTQASDSTNAQWAAAGAPLALLVAAPFERLGEEAAPTAAATFLSTLAEPALSIAHLVALPLSWGLATIAATLRSALLRSVPARVLAPVTDQERRRRLTPLLERADPLAATAGVLHIALDLVFALLVLAAVAADGPLTPRDALVTAGLVVPLLVVGGEILPSTVVGAHGDELLRRRLPLIAALLGPLTALGHGIEALRRALRESVGLEDDHAATRRVVEGLRGVVVESEFEGELDENEREIIGNVMEFHDVDAAAVMTPRTEVCGVELREGVRGAIRVAAECGHSRIPIYEKSLDRVVGVFSSRDVLELIDDEALDAKSLGDLMRPPFFVPETKRVSELLAEFRRERIKFAVVLDEYGGTSGLITIGDILGELVGDLPDEHDEDEPARLREVESGHWELDASLRVSEVNEELDLELPEEADYETIGGFVLAELGHFPKPGERVLAEEVEIEILEATDRRVRQLSLRRLATQPH
ncbi:MAG: hemolysin family protein [Planctomycetota bacterium]